MSFRRRNCTCTLDTFIINISNVVMTFNNYNIIVQYICIIIIQYNLFKGLVVFYKTLRHRISLA